MATRCQSTVMREYPLGTTEPTTAAEAELDSWAQHSDEQQRGLDSKR